MKTLKKKDFIIKEFKRVFSKSYFVFLIQTNNFTTIEHNILKKQLKEINLSIKIVKNNLFRKTVQYNFFKYKNITQVPHGSIILITPVNNEFDFNLSLKELYKTIKSNPKMLFLGGIFNNTIVSKYFLKDIFDLESEQTVYLNLIKTLSNVPNNIISSKKYLFTTLINNIKHI